MSACQSILLITFEILQNPRTVSREGTSGDQLVEAPMLKQGHPEVISRTMYRWLLNVSKDADSITPLGNLCQCSVTFTVKKPFLIFRETSYIAICAH